MSEALMHLFFLDNKSGGMSGEQQHEDSGGQRKRSQKVFRYFWVKKNVSVEEDSVVLCT